MVKNIMGHEINNNSQPIYNIRMPFYVLSLQQMFCLFSCHVSSSEWDVMVQEANLPVLTLSKMQYNLKSALIDPEAWVMVNYN